LNLHDHPLTTYHSCLPLHLHHSPTSLPTTQHSASDDPVHQCHGRQRRRRQAPVAAAPLRARLVWHWQHPHRRRPARRDADRVSRPRARDDDERHLPQGPWRRRRVFLVAVLVDAAAAPDPDGGGGRVGEEPERRVAAVRRDGDVGVLPRAPGRGGHGAARHGAGPADRADERDGGRRRGRAPGGPGVPRGRGGGRRCGGHGHAGARARRRAGRAGAPPRGAGDELHRDDRRRRHVHQRPELRTARPVAIDGEGSKFAGSTYSR
jgi:hypothetical protein